MATTPGITIDVPKRAPSSGPIPLRVTMVADMQTYYANNGILDNALDIVLVRRDAPGVQFVAKIDPHALMLPDPLIPPPPPGTDLARAGFIKEEREFDALGFGVRHDGAADYYVLASFAGLVTQPVLLSVEDRLHAMPGGEVIKTPLLTAEITRMLPFPPMSRGVVVQMKADPAPRVDGALRVAMPSRKIPGDKQMGPFLTIVAVCLSPTGGMSTGSFIVDARGAGEDSIAQFSIPLALLLPNPRSGRYRILAFSDDQYAPPVDAMVP
jgi:hypothetical protein